ncbi:uncharacterized protein LOC125676772 [Ostrea edulis]|uniref:uncharacterized protein LOC125676772 n=1 Tax=Ostrea edulis TaxID=37623 RepID=UPI0024AEE01B|nr:uncharacterized protein LOC125676772 [Ostrea edulis]
MVRMGCLCLYKPCMLLSCLILMAARLLLMLRSLKSLMQKLCAKDNKYLQYQKKSLKVEVLELSESRAFLNTFEDEWSSSHRSIALDNEKKKNKEHGYLSVWPHDQEDITEDQMESSACNNSDEETQENNEESNDQEERNIRRDQEERNIRRDQEERNIRRDQEERNVRRDLKGSKGRKISILYEGFAAGYSPDASPQRDPCYFRDLSTDEAEVVELQMKHFSAGKICSSSQTEQVVVIEDEQEIVDLISKQNGKKESREVSTQTDTVECLSSSVQTDSPNPDLAAIHRKLDEILGILHGGLDNSLKYNNISDIVRWVTDNTSTPQPGCASVTILPVEEAVLPAHCETVASPILTREPIPRDEEHIAKSPTYFFALQSNSLASRLSRQPSPASPSPPAKRILFEEDAENFVLKKDVEPNGEMEYGVALPFMDVTHRLNTKQSSKEEKVIEVE